MGSSFDEGRGEEGERQRIVPYLTGLYGYGVSLTGDTERARDLVQSCALRALTAESVPHDEPAYRMWLFRILRNTFFDQLRRERRDVHYCEDLGRRSESAATRNNVPLPDVYSVEKRMITVLAVREGLDKLGLAHREILMLVDAAGFAYHEAAELLQIPIGTVMSRLSRARKMLLLALEESNARAPRLALVRRRK